MRKLCFLFSLTAIMVLGLSPPQQAFNHSSIAKQVVAVTPFQDTGNLLTATQNITATNTGPPAMVASDNTGYYDATQRALPANDKRRGTARAKKQTTPRDSRQGGRFHRMANARQQGGTQFLSMTAASGEKLLE